ncbi:hypothetical protein D3C87_500060 [compost metagenome]
MNSRPKRESGTKNGSKQKTMIKRVILTILLYAIFLVGITLTMSSMDNHYLIAIVISSFVVAFLIGREVYKKYFLDFKPKRQNINYNNFVPNDLIRISTKPFLFGLEKKLLSDDEFYFDNENFYAINQENKTAKFDLKNITELSRTDVNINNRTIWQVKINAENKELVFKFAHNYTIWNKSFLNFYNRIKTLNPSVVKSKWSLWRM